MNKQYKTNITQNHPFHLVYSSPWPLVASLGALFITFGGVMYMHLYKNGLFLFLIGLFTIIYVMYCWWRDIVREGSFEGQHTKIVQHGLRMGMILFIISEIMCFFVFFFHSSLSPVLTIGGVWLPVGIEILKLWEIPLLYIILLSLMYSFSFRSFLKQVYGFITTGKDIYYHKKLYITNKSFYFENVGIPTFLDFNDCSLISHLVTPNYDLNDLDECANRIIECFPIEKEHHAIFKMLHLLESNGLLGEFIRFFGENHTLYKINNIYYLDFVSANLIVFIITQLQFYDFESDYNTQSIFWEKVCSDEFSSDEKENIKIFFNILYRSKNLDQFLKLWS